tara:strand:- start:1611 stop:1790 length:180 start_codon:yes stop_codon:yes gene_type:complete
MSEIANRRLIWAKHLQKENEKLKMLIVMMHGDCELNDTGYWQDMANDILAEYERDGGFE